MSNQKLLNPEIINSNNVNQITFHGLHQWFVKTFEKLGWIILHMNEGNIDKVNCYFNSIDRLLVSLNEKLNVLEENDRKNDIIIMINKVNVLKNFVENNLKNKNISKIQSGGKLTKQYSKPKLIRKSKKSSRKSKKSSRTNKKY